MDTEIVSDPIDASFDLVARQDATDEALGALRGDVDEVKSRLDRVARAASRPALGGGDASPELKGFVDGYLRNGRESQLKSLSGAVLADGGYAVPREIDALIANQLKTISPIRAIAQVVQTGTAGCRKLVTSGGSASGWVSEVALRPETTTPKFNEIAPPMGELYANPAASQAMLDDAAFNLEEWLASEIAMEFARAEGAAFINGTGTNQPRGFLQAPTALTSDATRAFGTLQHVVSGNASAFDTTPESKLIDLVHSLKSGHRQGAVFVMNSKTLSTVRKFKAADGSFIWQPGILDGAPARLLGYPLALGRDATIMPEFSTSVAVTASGFERRNSLWSDARLRFDVGPGLRSEAELGELLAFYRARRGAARGFRLRDPSDFSSNAMVAPPTPTDQLLGSGDALQTRFPLIKRYGEGPDAQVRRITRPVAGSVLVSVNGSASTGWTLDPLGEIVFAVAPPSGAAERAGFRFDVPVRFAEDRLEVSGAAFAAGEAPSVPIIEVREAV